MDDGVLASKLANAIVRQPQAVPVPGVALAADWVDDVPAMTGSSLRWARERHSGLWVGGRVTLTPRRLHFEANSLNKMVHVGSTEVDLRLKEILGVSVEPGLVSCVVCVVAGAELWLRCFGAKAFAEQIRQAVRDAHTGH